MRELPWMLANWRYPQRPVVSACMRAMVRTSAVCSNQHQQHG
jgi:hypothetical protein